MATSALDRLYQIDTPEALQECLNAFLTAAKGSFKTLSKEDEDKLINSILASDKPVDPELYSRYAKNLRKAVDAVPVDNDDLSAQWHANVSRFAAYKAYCAKRDMVEAATESDFEDVRRVLHSYNRYQAAEYNTAVARARTGKQWLQFSEPDSVRLFPNIQWLPSRSATPREEHMPFYNRIWPKDDPFWQTNQPGNLWNCKCDWEETDEDPTPDNPTSRIVKPGLEGNPATTGQIFTDNPEKEKSCHTYLRRVPFRIELDKATAEQYPALQSLLDINLREYRLDFYNDSGGFLQTSRERIKEGQQNKQELEKFTKEYSMCRTLAAGNMNISYLESVEGRYDITVNGIPADLKKVDSYKQIRHHASKAVNEQGANIVVFEFPSETREIHLELCKTKKLSWMQGKTLIYYFKNNSNKIHTL